VWPILIPYMNMSKTAVLCGVGGYVPPFVVTNDDLADRLDTSDEWIRVRTGIRQRHVVDAGTATSDLAVQAGAAALKSANADSVDMVILATTTPDHPCPATAPTVASRLGFEGVAAFDVSAVCSGFVYGLATATGFIMAGIVERALVIGADSFTTILNKHDRTTVSIFGDGAGAVVLRAGGSGEPGVINTFDLGSNGNLTKLMMVRAGGSRQPAKSSRSDAAENWFIMQGVDVYRHAVRYMVASSRRIMERVRWNPADVSRFVAHQANLRIIMSVAQGLGIPADRALVNLDQVGNTAAASIPLALTYGLDSGALRPGHKVLISTFGGGATWGSTALIWPEL
jgi:3-oxoacyl-[acyl-carrier-protein] synthase-3